MPLSNLLNILVNDIRNPALLWQVAAVVSCVALGWFLAQLIRSNYAHDAQRGGAVQRGVSRFGSVLTPLIVAGLIGISIPVLAPFLPNVSLLRVAFPLAGSLAVIRLAFYLLRRVFGRRGQIGAAIVTFEKIFALLVWLFVALYLTGLWPEVFGFLEGTTLPLGSHKVSLATMLQAVVSVVVLLMLALWAGAALEERLMGVEGLHTSLRVAMARMSRAVLILVAVLVSLSLVGIDLTVLSVFGGALGVGLGLGLQKIASNYVSGFVILLERSLAIGDLITVDKYTGKVDRINTRYTVLRNADGTESVVPNEMLVSGAVVNATRADKRARIATQLVVGFDTDLGRLLPELGAAVAGVPGVMADPAPVATFNRFVPNGFELEVGMWLAEPDKGRLDVLSEANMRIWTLLQSQAVTFPSTSNEVK